MPLESYTSGYKSFDAEKPSCLMNTHWNTVWSNRQSQGDFPVVLYDMVWLWQFQFHCKFHISRSGVRIPVKLIFSLFSFSQLSATDNHLRILFKNFIDWLMWFVIPSHITKNGLDWDSNPRPGNVDFDVELAQHAELQHTLDTRPNPAVEGKRESALWLPIASHSAPMGVHWAVCSFRVNRFMARGVYVRVCGAPGISVRLCKNSVAHARFHERSTRWNFFFSRKCSCFCFWHFVKNNAGLRTSLSVIEVSKFRSHIAHGFEIYMYPYRRT